MAYPIQLKEPTNQEAPISVATIAIYFLVWYIFTITTYGVWIPAGLFLPGILIGCSIGILYLELMIDAFDLSIYQIGGQSYIIMGASAMLASYCRLTYSLAVIMLETTQSINLFLPIVFSIMVALGVARACNRSLY